MKASVWLCVKKLMDVLWEIMLNKFSQNISSQGFFNI